MGWIADYAKLQRSDSGRVDWLAKSEQFASRLVEREFADSGGSGLRSLQAHLVTYRGREGVCGAVYKQIEDKWVTAQISEWVDPDPNCCVCQGEFSRGPTDDEQQRYQNFEKQEAGAGYGAMWIGRIPDMLQHVIVDMGNSAADPTLLQALNSIKKALAEVAKRQKVVLQPPWR